MCAVELYAEAFEEAGALENFESFMSENGARFYGLALNQERISLVRKQRSVPSKIAVASSEPIIPIRAGLHTLWSIC